MSRRPDRSHKASRSPWFPILLIVIGLGYGIGGLWFLTFAARRPSVVAAAQTPSPQPTATAVPFPPTWTPTLPPTATTLPTPPATAGPQVLTHVTIVHSNDTWGYTLPCG